MKNRGMYIEELINKTISYYNSNNIGSFEKRNLPISIKEINNNFVTGYLKEKSKVDYFGLFKTKHVEFESKQTTKNYFSFSLFKEHQLKYLFKIHEMGSISFLIIHFFNIDSTIAINCDQLKYLFKTFKNKKISYGVLKKHGKEITLIFPGILNLIEFLENLV